MKALFLPADPLEVAFTTLRFALDRFTSVLDAEVDKVKHLNEVRIDDGVTQLYINLDREQCLWRIAVAGHVGLNIAALLKLREEKGVA